MRGAAGRLQGPGIFCAGRASGTQSRSELLSRALIGAALVSLFAALGDWPRPKRFAGLFRAAPSVARATLPLTGYAATEARSMLCGALAFLLCAARASQLLIRRRSFGAGP
jgi:hypothetical protein